MVTEFYHSLYTFLTVFKLFKTIAKLTQNFFRLHDVYTQGGGSKHAGNGVLNKLGTGFQCFQVLNHFRTNCYHLIIVLLVVATRAYITVKAA